MKQFPQALFIAPGNEKLEAGMFTTRLVHDEAERDAALSDGWHTNQEDAWAAHEAAKAERIAAALKISVETVLDNTPRTGTDDAEPTRAELEQKATELGVEFSPKIGDKKLAERIAAALAEQSA